MGSRVVVGRASVSPRHEGRLGWPSADGAGGRGRRGGRPGYKPGWGLDPHRLLPVEPTNLASAPSLLASLAWRALWLLADAPMLSGWDVSDRGHWAQLPRGPRPLVHSAGEQHQVKTLWCVRGSCC